MKYASITLCSVGLVLSTLTFANSVEKMPTSAQGYSSHPDYCPPPSTLVYSGGKWLGETTDHRWESDSEHPKVISKPEIKFLGAYVISASGNKPNLDTTSHVICTYKIDRWEEIITLQHAYRAQFNAKITFKNGNSENWKFFPYPNNSDIGEWRCSKNFDECTFEFRYI